MSRFASSAGYNVNFGALFAAVMITVLPVLVVAWCSNASSPDRCHRAR